MERLEIHSETVSRQSILSVRLGITYSPERIPQDLLSPHPFKESPSNVAEVSGVPYLLS